MSRRAAARRFGVSDGSVINGLRHHRETGRRTPVGAGDHPPSVPAPHRDPLQAARAAQPDNTLAALGARLAAGRGVRAE